MSDTRRRDYVIDLAIAAGKFTESRRAHWSTAYDSDPYATEQVLAAMQPSPFAPPSEGFASPYSAQLFPELSRQAPPPPPAPAAPAVLAPPAPTPPAPVVVPPRSVMSAPAGGEPDRDVAARVAAWSRDLFPDAVPEGAPWPQIAYANDG